MLYKKLLLSLLNALLLLIVTASISLAAPVENEFLDLVNSYADQNGQIVEYPIQVKVWGDDFYTHVETLDGYTLIRDPETGAICYAVQGQDGGLVSSTVAYTGLDSKEEQEIEIELEKANKKHITENDKKIREHVRKHKKLLLSLDESTDVSDNILDEMLYGAPNFDIDEFLGGGSDVNPANSAGNFFYNDYYAGSVKGLTLLISFPGDTPTLTPAQVDEYCNGLNYTGFNNRGSVRQFYLDVSDGALDYTNVVMSYYYVSKQPKSYYTDPRIAHGTRARELIIEALADLSSKGFNFNQLSKDSTGAVRALNAFYVGSRTNAWAEGLWPHKSSLSYTTNGVRFYSYQISDMPSSLGIGTFAHENGHMVCNWPDTYDYTYISNGAGRYDLMSSSNSTNPCPPNPYFRNVMSGWGEPELINNFAENSTISVNANKVAAQIFCRSGNNEFYILENVQATGRWSNFGTSGMYVWHIDKYGNRDYSDMTPTKHFVVSLVQADGLCHLEKGINSGDSRDAFYSGNVSQITDTTNPGTKWWDGSSSGISITGISAAGSVMRYTYNNSLAKPESLTVSPTTMTLDVNATRQLTAEVLPVNCTDKTVTWLSGNTTVATVSVNGLVTARSPGTATITAKTVNDLTATCVVTVPDNVPPVITLTGGSSLTIDLGKPFVEPGYKAVDNIDGDITDKVVVSGSVNTSVAGVYTLTYTVFDTAGNKAEVKRTVTVSAPRVSFSFNNSGKTGASFNNSFTAPFNGEATFTVTGVDSKTNATITVKDSAGTVILTNTFTSNGSKSIRIAAGTYTITTKIDKTNGNSSIGTSVVVIGDGLEIPRTAPTVKLVGSSQLVLHLGGSPYVEQGVTATDSEDGNISSLAVVESNVDTSKAGEYTVKYTVTNSADLSSSVVRGVSVIAGELKTVPGKTFNFSPKGKQGESFTYTFDATSEGDVSLTATVPNKTTVTVTVTDSSGEQVFKGTLSANATRSFQVTAGKYTVKMTIDAANGNTTCGLIFVTPGGLEMVFPKPEVIR